MAANKVELQEAILRAVDAVVTQRNNELQLDKTITGTIKKNIGKRGGKPLYQVQYNGGIIEAVTQGTDDVYSPQMGVYVLVPQGNFSNEKIIIGRSANISTDRTTSVVAAAINNYSIVGANLLTSIDGESIKTKQFGLRSFHPEFRDTGYTNESIDHRAQFLYRYDRETNPINFQNDKFNIYKNEATAIMIKADFLTNLDSIQRNRASARYGLIFNFAFDNLNKGYGETNGEILDNISKLIDGKIEDSSEQGFSKKNLYDDIIGPSGDFGQYISSSSLGDIKNWTDDNTGKLDQTIENVNILYQCFKVDNAKLDKEIIANAIQGFINLLKELKTKQTVTDIQNEYTQWRSQVVGDDSQKYVQFVLSSDDMMGNPFVFSTWNTQYAVFDIDLETFNHLDSILFYKEGFVTDTKDEETNSETQYEYNWPIHVTGGGPDIFVRNLQIYAMNPLDNQSGDYTLNVQPYAGLDMVISSESPRTQFKATLLRKFYEDLTANSKTIFYWFKEDSSVINSASKNYNYLGGTGWRKLDHNETNYLFTTTIEDNHAYKNNYKCVAVYEPAVDDKTILSFTFAVYNEDMNTDIKLESDLGTRFSFDAGAPTIKVLINEDRVSNAENYQEIGFNEIDENPPKYLYSWTIDDAANGYTLFLDELNEILINENISIKDAYALSQKEGLLKRIKAYILDELTTKTSYATRIQYPISIASSGFTVTCYVKQRGSNGSYYDVGSASLEFENQNESIGSGYRIHIVNGDQVFQYDEYGNTPCSDKKKDPLVVKPLQAKLFTPSGLEVEGTNYQVEWILPIENTMIVNAGNLILNPSTGLNQSYKASELNFSIAKLYNPNAYANQITCHIHFGEEDLYKDTNFYFGKQGSNGTNGTDTVAKINCTLADPTNILHYQPLTLYIQKNEDDTKTGMLNVGSNGLQSSISLAHVKYSNGNQQLEQSGPLQLFVYQKEEEMDVSNFKGTYPKWNLAGNANERVNNTSTIFAIESTTEEQSLIWNDTSINNTKYRLQNIRTSVQLKDNQMYYAFFSLPVIEYEYSTTSVAELISTNRISIDKDFYLNEIVYNADGRNPIYNHNQGLRLYNIPDNITKIVWTAKGGLVTDEDDPWILLLEEKGSDNGTTEIIANNPQNNASMVYILPKDIYDGSATNNRIEAQLYDNETLIATVYAPINMTLNTFGLASLNAWDGNTVTIDEEGGYVMAPQVGAGEKDDNNRFTGILMGKTETYTGGGDNEKQIGLFGYKDGLQSIFLDSETGKAIFGLPDADVKLDDNGKAVLDDKGNIVRTYQHTTRDTGDNYNEGRIELIPGGVSKIGGWRLGRRSLYYTKSGNIADRYTGDYVPEKDTGVIKQISAEPYSGHHEKDIDHEDSGILLHSGEDPYFSIKGPKLESENIEKADLGTYLREGDSLEIQLDPKAPTLFTVFRHNGNQWKKQVRDKDGNIIEKTIYDKDTRTYLAGINGKGEFVANSVSSIVQLNGDDDDDSAYATNFSVNSFRAFNDIIDNEVEIPQHTGLRMKIGNHILGQMFVSNTGLDATLENRDEEGNWINNPTLFITGGLTESNGEYTRPISIHGKWVNLFAEDSRSSYNVLTETDANLKLQQNNFETNIGDSAFKLFRDKNNSQPSNLMSANNLKINAGIEADGQPIEYYSYYTDDSGHTAKINKRNVSDLYISWQDAEDINKKHYALYGSWIGNEVYIENPDPNDENLFINVNNYPRCYRVTERGNVDEYCIEEDFKNIFYHIENRPSDADVENYILENVLRENRCTLKNNKYNLIEDSTVEFNTNQFFRARKKISDEEILDQSYIYIKEKSLNQNILYAKYYDLNNTLYYVYRPDNLIYCKINNEYVLKSSLDNIEPKIKILNEGYYNDQDVDMDTIYYQYNDENNIFYVSSFVSSNWYVKEILTNEFPPTYDDEGNLIEHEPEFIENYRLYDEENDSDEEVYFFYQNNYFNIKNLGQDEYIYITASNKWVLRETVLSNIYVYNGNDYDFTTFINIYNTNYYKVQTFGNNEFYIDENKFNKLAFNYWYYPSLVDNSNYILSSNVLLNNRYTYAEKLYIVDNENGTYYQTNILDPNKENTYVYISLNPNQNISIDFNKKYYYNQLDSSPWKLYTNNKLITNDPDKPNSLYEYVENERYYLYYWQNGQVQIKDFVQLTQFYSVRDIENRLFYIEKNYLDNYTQNNSLYLYLNGFKKIVKENDSQDDDDKKIIESVSTQKYELYAGHYFSKITTNEQSNRYISLEEDNNGINFFNSSGPINLISEDPIFNLKIRKKYEDIDEDIDEIGGELSFGSSSAMFKEEHMLGKFIVDNAENGLILTNTWLRLKSKANTLIESPTTISLISETQGNGNVYGDGFAGLQQPQIVFRAGSKEAIRPGVTTVAEARGSQAELILNSSNNGWASVIKNKSFTTRLSYPVFKVGTTYSSIGIYPEIFNAGGKDYYRENFYVGMPQYNSMGLKVDGHTPSSTASNIGLNVTLGGYFGGIVKTNAGFYGKGDHITNTCDGRGASPSGPNSAQTLGNSISINIPKITVNKGRPSFSTQSISFSYSMPTASNISYGMTTVKEALDNRPTEARVKEIIASELKDLKTSIKNKADKDHTHTFKYYTISFKDKEGHLKTAIDLISRLNGTHSVTI